MQKIKLVIILFFAFVHISGVCQNWTAKANYGGANCTNGVGFSIGTKGYIGIGGNGQQFWEWDQAGDSWTQMATYPGAITNNASGFSIADSGYVSSGATTVNPFVSNELYKWQGGPTGAPGYNTWTAMTSLGGVNREDPVSFRIGNKGYTGTGFDRTNHLVDFWEYDPVTDSWTQMANFIGAARDDAAGFSIGDSGYIGTGHGAAEYNDFYMWQGGNNAAPGYNTWVARANFPGAARNHATGLSIGSKGYMGLGRVPYYQDFYEYDPAADTWTAITNFPGTARAWAEAFSIECKGYVGCGFDGGQRVDFYEYDPGAGCILLPIELLTFSVKWNDDNYNSALVEWETSSEINNDYFQIERSLDGINFSPILQQIAGAVNSYEPIKYKELDSDPYAESVSYYRLKQVDLDGTFSYSQIEVLNIPEGIKITNLFPNPISELLNFSLLSSSNTKSEIAIMNSLGQIVSQFTYQLERGNNSIKLELPELKRGNYYVKVISEEKSSTQRKFIVTD